MKYSYSNSNNPVKFLDLHIGDVFFKHNTFWVKTTREVARDLNPEGYRCCTFTLDADDAEVMIADLKMEK